MDMTTIGWLVSVEMTNLTLEDNDQWAQSRIYCHQAPTRIDVTDYAFIDTVKSWVSNHLIQIWSILLVSYDSICSPFNGFEEESTTKHRSVSLEATWCLPSEVRALSITENLLAWQPVLLHLSHDAFATCRSVKDIVLATRRCYPRRLPCLNPSILPSISSNIHTFFVYYYISPKIWAWKEWHQSN